VLNGSWLAYVSLFVPVFVCQGFNEGLGTLLQSAICQFPLTFDEPMNLLRALSKAGHDSALQVGARLCLSVLCK